MLKARFSSDHPKISGKLLENFIRGNLTNKVFFIGAAYKKFCIDAAFDDHL